MLERFKDCFSIKPEPEPASAEIQDGVPNIRYVGGVTIKPYVYVYEGAYSDLINIAFNDGLIKIKERDEYLGLWNEAGDEQKACLIEAAAESVGLVDLTYPFQGKTNGGVGNVVLENGLVVEVETIQAATERSKPFSNLKRVKLFLTELQISGDWALGRLNDCNRQAFRIAKEVADAYWCTPSRQGGDPELELNYEATHLLNRVGWRLEYLRERVASGNNDPVFYVSAPDELNIFRNEKGYDRAREYWTRLVEVLVPHGAVEELKDFDKIVEIMVPKGYPMKEKEKGIYEEHGVRSISNIKSHLTSTGILRYPETHLTISAHAAWHDIK